jgi:hypothetical protein
VRDGAVNLAVDRKRIDDPAAIMGDDKAFDFNQAGFRINRHRGEVGGVVDRRRRRSRCVSGCPRRMNGYRQWLAI